MLSWGVWRKIKHKSTNCRVEGDGELLEGHRGAGRRIYHDAVAVDPDNKAGSGTVGVEAVRAP
jgi:hypothetical protein